MIEFGGWRPWSVGCLRSAVVLVCLGRLALRSLPWHSQTLPGTRAMRGHRVSDGLCVGSMAIDRTDERRDECELRRARYKYSDWFAAAHVGSGSCKECHRCCLKCRCLPYPSRSCGLLLVSGAWRVQFSLACGPLGFSGTSHVCRRRRPSFQILRLTLLRQRSSSLGAARTARSL